jgi:hypothetical protein
MQRPTPPQSLQRAAELQALLDAAYWRIEPLPGARDAP